MFEERFDMYRMVKSLETKRDRFIFFSLALRLHQGYYIVTHLVPQVIHENLNNTLGRYPLIEVSVFLFYDQKTLDTFFLTMKQKIQNTNFCNTKGRICIILLCDVYKPSPDGPFYTDTYFRAGSMLRRQSDHYIFHGRACVITSKLITAPSLMNYSHRSYERAT